MSIIESEKLQYPEFLRTVNQEPIEVLYQVQTKDTFTSSGYSFYIKSPGQGCLLDPDVWIHYTFSLLDSAPNYIGNSFCTGAAANALANIYPAVARKIAYRGGNIVQRFTQNINVIINGHSISCEPWKFVEELNRLYVSDEQSKHEFSASGGRFDSGNHSARTISECASTGLSAAIGAGNTLGANINLAYHTNAETHATAGASTLITTPPVARSDYFINEGYSDRVLKFADIVRRSQVMELDTGLQYGPVGNNNYSIHIYERLPCPPFKMYSNDNVSGCIPNIRDLTIRGQFSSNMLGNAFRSNTGGAGANIAITMNTGATCELLLKWYTPPINVSIPKEISIPLRKIGLWAKEYTLPVPAAANEVSAALIISEYNISLDAVPDMLLIYVKHKVDSLTTNMPDSYHLELQDIQLSVGGAPAKLSLIQPIQMYNNWKKLLKHQDSKIAPYDEWRKYHFVAALLPEDYGILKGPGYENPIIIGIKANAYSYWNFPRMGLLAVEAYPSTIGELVVCSIYDKWSLTIRDSGSAQSELTRISSALPSIQAASASMGLRGLL